MYLAIVSTILVVLITVILLKKGGFFSSRNTVSIGMPDYSIYEILVPRSSLSEINVSALAAEQMFASLHGVLDPYSDNTDHFSFEIASSDKGVKFYFLVPKQIEQFVEAQIYAQYPTAKIVKSVDYFDEEVLARASYEAGYYAFERDFYFPIKHFRDFEVDPISSLMSVMSEVQEGESIWFQIIAKPLPDGWQDAGRAYIANVVEGKPIKSGGAPGFIIGNIARELGTVLANVPKELLRGRSEPLPPGKPAGTEIKKLTAFQELEVRSIENKLTKMGYESNIRFIVAAGTQGRVESLGKSLSASMKQYSTVTTNSFNFQKYPDQVNSLQKYSQRIFTDAESLLLTNEELATIFHLPSNREDAPNVSWVNSKSGEPPVDLPTEDCVIIGETRYRGKKVRFGVKEGNDRLRHMYLIGKTGSGKSTLLVNMINQDIMAGNGVGVLDPHGETIDAVLNHIPDHRLQDVIYFDPSDTGRPIGLNLLEIDDPSQKNLMASALLSAVKQHFDYSWGPRLEYLLNYCLLTLLEVPGTSMLGITRLMEDKNYLNYILQHVEDPVIRKFWEVEFKDMKNNQKLVTEAIAPIQNKVNRFLASTTIRNILGQRKSTINIWDIMQNKKILLMNLSKGKIGTDNANLLGALLVSRIQFMALQRARISAEERVPFYLYVDEFRNFATGSFEEILSESRKYKLGLHLTHQYTAQLPEDLLKAVFGNVGTIATFSLGAPDARVLANEFAPYFDDQDIISLEKFQIYIKLMVDGATTLPFSAKILLPWVPEESLVPATSNKERVIRMSREKYGTDSEYVSELIARWVNRPFDKGMAIAEIQRAKKEAREAAEPAMDALPPATPTS